MNAPKANLDTPDIRDIKIYNNGNLAFLDKLSDINMPESVQMEIYVIVLCLQGKASLYINGDLYVAYKNDIFICSPNNLLENCLLSVDFKCHCVGMSPKYIQKILPMADNTWDIKIFFEKFCILPKFIIPALSGISSLGVSSSTVVYYTRSCAKSKGRFTHILPAMVHFLLSWSCWDFWRRNVIFWSG